MLFDKEDEKEKNDFFDGSEPVEEPEQRPKKPVFKPDDPKYWDEEESEWSHLQPRSRWRLWVIIGAAVIVLGLVIGCWLRYFSPYIEDATQYGYVEHLERRGTLFKTYEGVLIPYRELMDTTKIYNRDFVFSVGNDSTAAFMKQAQLLNKPVRVAYKQYHASVPWRGSSKIIILDADTVPPERVVPPDFLIENTDQ